MLTSQRRFVTHQSSENEFGSLGITRGHFVYLFADFEYFIFILKVSFHFKIIYLGYNAVKILFYNWP